MQYLLKLLREIIVGLQVIGGQQQQQTEQNDRIINQSRHIIRRQNRIEDLLSANQDKLDSIAAQLSAVGEGLTADIADLKTQIANGTPAEQLDFSAVDARVQALTDLDAQNPGPVPAPVEPADPNAL